MKDEAKRLVQLAERVRSRFARDGEVLGKTGLVIDINTMREILDDIERGTFAPCPAIPKTPLGETLLNPLGIVNR